MNYLAKETCVACRRDAPLVPDAEIPALHEQIPGWDIVTYNNVKQLKKHFTFKNFTTALDFTNKIGTLAEKEFHHPRLITEWQNVTVLWWSHKIKGLHRNDFIMCAKSDQIYQAMLTSAT